MRSRKENGIKVIDDLGKPLEAKGKVREVTQAFLKRAMRFSDIESSEIAWDENDEEVVLMVILRKWDDSYVTYIERK